ncbi:energy-coupled thiamine transporter ThiT [Salipaludibacillus keqinensis]|uniref:Energy-coupled thiamine transporter ThiT n=1 Tax=Salipaludibacillus keqinensis TaxID=2045207 RepID=A0A323TFK7_9BACI|nr:energy-coupled thiamine transporter ThiT [Salipaludibacillus keqinensis]PYZ93196.1 energy-coupled thiamine transporter ThiT [Salipaludibacillus keqinensis]
MKNARPTLLMAEISIMAALAVILDLMTFLRFWPQGGSVSLAMVPILIMAFRRGVKAGMLTGLIFGTVNMMYNSFIVHWLQALLDYPIAFAVIGLAGIFAINHNESQSRRIIMITAGVILGVALRLLSHFTAGVVWFGEFAPEGTPVALYAFTYNLSYLFPSLLICLAIVLLLGNASKKIIQPSLST